jgi:hypothetical protein
MERTEILDMMGALKLYGMKAAYDETLVVALKRSLLGCGRLGPGDDV